LNEQKTAIRKLLVMPMPTNATAKMAQVSVATRSIEAVPQSPTLSFESAATPASTRGRNSTGLLQNGSSKLLPLNMSNPPNANNKSNHMNSTDVAYFGNLTGIRNLSTFTNTTALTNSTKKRVQSPSIATCTTRLDERVQSMIYVTSPPGTPCVFGLDVRDEGAHCIFDDGEYGSLGWCYTDENKEGWGACGESCPLYGQTNLINRKINQVLSELKEEGDLIRMVFSTSVPLNTTSKTQTFPTVNVAFDASLPPPNVSLSNLTRPAVQRLNATAFTKATVNTTLMGNASLGARPMIMNFSKANLSTDVPGHNPTDIQLKKPTGSPLRTMTR